MSDIEQAVAESLMPLGLAAENVASIGNADQWIPDTDAARTLLAALAERGYHVTRSEGLDVERLARALRDTMRVNGWTLVLSEGTSWEAVAAAIAREYGVTRSDREARLEAALRPFAREYLRGDYREAWDLSDSVGEAELRALFPDLSEAPE